MSLIATTRQPSLFHPSDLADAQQDVIDRLFEHDHTLLVAKMGAGKTVCTLTAFAELQRENVRHRLLVIAPLKVCDNTWGYEHARWSHLQHLRVAVATGNEKQRRAAIESPCDVLVINLENVAWLFDNYRDQHGCDALVVDELSKFKNVGGVGHKKLRRRLGDFGWRVGMTGTPVSEDWVGLYGQMMVVDRGAALGTDKQRFLDTYFYPTDYNRRNWALRGASDKALVAQIRDGVYTMPDYRSELPPIEYYTDTVTMSAQAMAVYKQLKRDMLIQIEDGALVVAQNEAVLTGKLAQAASGFLYDTESEAVEVLHHAKFEHVQRMISEIDRPVLLSCWFQYDRDILAAVLGCPIYGKSKSKTKTKQLEDEWNNGQHKVMLIHPRSAGHGLNLQDGGADLIWYGPQWSRDLWEQLNARLWRRGQKSTVRVYVIETADTIDQIISARVENKGAFDRAFMAHLQAL